MRAIKEASAPKDKQQLRSFLGLLNCYGKFHHNLSTKLASLLFLLEKGNGWQRTKTHQNAFDSTKDLLTSSKVLTHFNSKKEVILACDASPYGVGAVLAHKFLDGSEHPVASRIQTEQYTELMNLELIS